MTERDRELMERAVNLAENCTPTDPSRTPRLGVVIAQNGVVIGQAFRGVGGQDDDHAELKAVSTVVDKTQLAGASVYTTLEPCTRHVRRSTTESCADLLTRHAIKKVFVGILDPNQGVSGKWYRKATPEAGHRG